ncbi:hypothetical protein BC830DRAFT_1089611 [Chytriomyces sp. MP71]|nr:hypothetical protein BC830DRAFT_1089611 [Chytriomyces sp. MP71]
MSATVPKGCIPLSGSMVCDGGFSKYFAFLDQAAPNPVFFDTASFDVYMNTWADASPQFVAQMQNQYGCPGYNASTPSPFRYHLTAYCGVWAFIGSSSPCGTPVSPQMPTPVCADSVKDFVTSWNAVMNNPSICMSNPTTDMQAKRATYLTLFTELLKGGLANAGCTASVTKDASSFCGFPNITAGQAWCNSNYDICCNGAVTGNGLMQVQPSPAASPAPTPTNVTKAPQTSGGVPIIPIAIGGGTGLLLLIAILACCIWRSRTQKREFVTGTGLAPSSRDSYVSYDAKNLNKNSHDERNNAQPNTYGSYPYEAQDAYAMGSVNQQQSRDAGFDRAGNKSRESHYKEILPAQPSSAIQTRMQQDQVEKTYWTILNFRAENPDEMSLAIGDVVTIQKHYNDGWSFGANVKTGALGVFPYECVAEAPNMKSKTPGKSQFNNRASSLYGDSMGSQADDGSFIILFDYYPAMADELELHPGDRVTVVEEYDDGWAFGQHIRTGMQGLFPLDILQKYNSSRMGADTLRRIRESSRESMYSTLKKPAQKALSLGVPLLQMPPAIKKQQQAQQEPESIQGKIVAVLYDFSPAQMDEVALRRGDRVFIKKEYDDGWGYGTVMSSAGAKNDGLFPLDALALNTNQKPTRKERLTSIYGSFEMSAQSGMEHVRYEFQPERPDEILLRVGDEVIVNQEFDDGWALGVNMTTGKEGNFPLDCLSSYADPGATSGSKMTKVRVSSIFDAAPGSTAPKSGESDKVVNAFQPERPDEIVLSVGDSVIVNQSYDDGWGYGTNISTDKEGNFPLDCLASFADSTPTAEAKQPKQRQSSIYDGHSYYTTPTNTNSVYTLPQSVPASVYSLNITKPNEGGRSDKVVYAFQPERSDEIALRVGDTVSIQQEYDDGWCCGKNISTGREGNFPLDCLASYKDPKDFSLKKKQRISSLYGSEYGNDENEPIEVARLGPDLVAFSFTASKNDEVTLSVGDKVNITKSYDDGWCYGINLTRMGEGYFPYDCLASYAARHKNTSAGKKQRTSSIYDADFSYGDKQEPEIAKVGPDTVAFTFTPSKSDEVRLDVGDRVNIRKAYDDGWCYGINLTKKGEGYFPYDCLASYAARHKNTSAGKKQRVSSIYDAEFSYFEEQIPVSSAAKLGPDQVVFAFTTSKSDEVALAVGDNVNINKAYDDGWCFGTNTSTRRNGYFPWDCLASYVVNNPSVKSNAAGKKQRVSSIYDVQAPSIAANISDSESDVVVYAFSPQNSDECALRVSDRVVVKHEFDDGWCFGVNMSTGEEGSFPLDCLASRSRPDEHPTMKSRMSSLYGVTPATSNTDNETHSIYGTPSTSAMLLNMPPPPEDGTQEVIYTFSPERDDELLLRPGDHVIVMHSFDDGWSYGKNVSDGGREGNFPNDCLKPTADGSSVKNPKQRGSSIYGAPNTNSIYQINANQPGIQSREVLYDFAPQNADEVTLFAGDQVEILKIYDDGWCLIHNLTSGQEGLCPEDCIAGFNDGGIKYMHKQRMSSMYGANSGSYY